MSSSDDSSCCIKSVAKQLRTNNARSLQPAISASIKRAIQRPQHRLQGSTILLYVAIIVSSVTFTLQYSSAPVVECQQNQKINNGFYHRSMLPHLEDNFHPKNYQNLPPRRLLEPRHQKPAGQNRHLSRSHRHGGAAAAALLVHSSQSHPVMNDQVQWTQRSSNLNNPSARYYHDHDNSIQKLLPNGPPPFRPTNLLVSLGSTGLLEKLKQTQLFKRAYKSRVYYLFIDTLQQLAILMDKIAKKKVDMTEANLLAIQGVVNKIVIKGGQKLKLNWPLVMLNPHFIKEILASPTFLVMLFHAIEVTYMSMPMRFWLKPLVKLVKQPSYEREEEIWWKRKRLYDTINGLGSSELQPNLKTIHFKNPGEPASVSFSHLVDVYRQLKGKPAPDPHHYQYPVDNIKYDTEIPSNLYANEQQQQQESDQSYQVPPIPTSVVYSDNVGVDNHNHFNDSSAAAPMTSDQVDAFLANQSPQAQYNGLNSDESRQHRHKLTKVVNHNWQPLANDANEHKQKKYSTELHELPLESASSSQLLHQHHLQHNLHQMDYLHNPWLEPHIRDDQLMSQSEFDALDSYQKDIVLRETRQQLDESRMTNGLIEQQNDYIDSLKKGSSSP